MNRNCACKSLISLSLFGIISLFTVELCFPIIFEHMWPINSSPIESLKFVHQLQNELYLLESELTEIWDSEHNAVQSFFEEELTPYLAASDALSQQMENYVQSYGPIRKGDIDEVVKASTESLQLWHQYYENITIIMQDAQYKFNNYSEKIHNISGFWAQWTLQKNIDKVAELGYILDAELTKAELQKEYSLLSFNSSIQIVGMLLHYFEKSENLKIRLSTLHHRTESIIDTTDSVRPNNLKTRSNLTEESEKILALSVELLKDYKYVKEKTFAAYKTNIHKFVLVYQELMMSLARIQNIFAKIVKREEESRLTTLTDQIKGRLEAATVRQTVALEQYLLNIHLRMSPDLDDAAKDEL